MSGLRSWLVSLAAFGLVLTVQTVAQAEGEAPSPKEPPSVAVEASPAASAAPAGPVAARAESETRTAEPAAAPAPEAHVTVSVPTPAASVSVRVRVRARDVFYGQCRAFQRPAVLDTQKVFDAISFYQEVKSEQLTKKSGRYWILMQKSNRIFYKALRRLASEQGYDLIGDRTAILIDGAPPTDVTNTLLTIIPSITLD